MQNFKLTLFPGTLVANCLKYYMYNQNNNALHNITVYIHTYILTCFNCATDGRCFFLSFFFDNLVESSSIYMHRSGEWKEGLYFKNNAF